MKVSAIILTRNEENNIINCLSKLQFADEIIIIDNNSADKTVQIALDKKARVYSYQGSDFSGMRSLGKNKAKYDWLLYIDADEIVTGKLAKEIKNSLSSSFSAFALFRRNYYFNRLWPAREKMVRLIKKNALVAWRGPLHETAVIKGKIGQLKEPLLHYTHNDLSGMVEKTNLWSEIEARLRLENNHPRIVWWRLIRVMVTAFWNSYISQKGYKAGIYGLIESIYQAFSIFVTYAKLWEMQNLKRKS